MSISPRRLFTLLDAMTLVAATAVGLGIARGMHDLLWMNTNMTVKDGSVGAVLLTVARWTALGLPLIVAWTIGLFLLHWRRPRPSLGDFLHRPGATACGAAVFALAIEAVNLTTLLVVVLARQSMSKSSYSGMAECLVDCLIRGLGIEIGMPGLAVAVAWMMLALSGRWEPDPGWLDRTGRLVGVGWIVLMVVDPWLLLTFLGGWS